MLAFIAETGTSAYHEFIHMHERYMNLCIYISIHHSAANPAGYNGAS